MASGLPAHVDEADLISYGLIGLINAIERFEPTREIKFETYAITRIKGAIIDELRSLDWVPRSRPRPGPRDREGQRQARAPAAARADRRGDGAPSWRSRSRSSRIRCCRSPTRRSPRSTSCGPSATRAATRCRCSTRCTTPTRPIPPRSWTPTDLKDRVADAIARAARAREARRRALLLREPDAPGDRRGPRRDRVAGQPAAHEGRPAAALAARRLIPDPRRQALPLRVLCR